MDEMTGMMQKPADHPLIEDSLRFLFGTFRKFGYLILGSL